MSRELIQKAKKGDSSSLNELINKHKEVAYSIAFKYLKNKEDAEDVIQNAFIIVLNSIKNFRSESKFSTWLYKIIYHECLKEMKHRNQTIEYVPQFIKPEIQTEPNQEEIKLDKLLTHLTPNEFTIISLFYLKEKSVKEISQITSFSQSNIKVILYRARTKMKEMYNTNRTTNER